MNCGTPKNKQKEQLLNKIPIFLAKTYRIVDNPSYNDIISWAPQGDTFVVHNISQLIDEVFPKHFKHNNFLSFIRQLNMYGFKKLPNSDGEGAIFQHEYFKRDDLSCLHLIKRKNTNEQTPNNQQLVPLSTREESLEKEAILLRTQHEQLHSIMQVLMQQNKLITTQNKAFLSMMTQMSQKYRKKLQAMMLLFLFGKKKKSEQDILLFPQFSNVIETFEKLNNGNLFRMLPMKKKKSNQLPMLTDGQHYHCQSDGQHSQFASQFDKEQSEDIFKVLNRSKSRSVINDVEEEQKVEKEIPLIPWKEGIPLSPLSYTSRPQRIYKHTEWDEDSHPFQHSDQSQLELQHSE